jgi:RNA polymerase sigma-70 factor (ECF subfamily)
VDVTTKRGNGDERARFEQLYRQNYSRVLAFTRRRTGSATAEDVVATTFLVAWRRRTEIKGDPLPWLLGVARRVLANELRATRRADSVAQREAAMAERPGQARVAAFDDRPLALALASIHERDREALMLTAWDELTPAEAARVVGCSAATFRVRLHRARRKFARALEEELESDERSPASRTQFPVTEAKG